MCSGLLTTESLIDRSLEFWSVDGRFSRSAPNKIKSMKKGMNSMTEVSAMYPSSDFQLRIFKSPRYDTTILDFYNDETGVVSSALVPKRRSTRKFQ